MADPTVGRDLRRTGATEHQFESFPGRDIALDALTVTRVPEASSTSACNGLG